VSSHPSRVTLRPLGGTVGLKGRALSLQRPMMKTTPAIRLINASKTETLALDNVQGHDDDIMGLLGPTSMSKRKIPLGLGLPRCPKGNILLLLGANIQFLLTSGWCCNIHIWDLSPHEGLS
jgi:hypothetical protein